MDQPVSEAGLTPAPRQVAAVLPGAAQMVSATGASARMGAIEVFQGRKRALLQQQRGIVVQLAELLQQQEELEELQQEQQQRQQQQYTQQEQQQQHLCLLLEETRQQGNTVQQLRDEHAVEVQKLQQENGRHQARMRELAEENRQLRVTIASQRGAMEAEQRQHHGATDLQCRDTMQRQAAVAATEAAARQVTDGVRTAHGFETSLQQQQQQQGAGIREWQGPAARKCARIAGVAKSTARRRAAAAPSASRSRAPTGRAGGAAGTGKANGEEGQKQPRPERQSDFCPHGRTRYFCKDYGGAGMCQHGRRRRRCKDCGGAEI
eukprot:TRINITY_DN3617_c0_g6_i1.p1 TRINITY_DN3617_c0_g6~~TRINITY_DN3617_c0_g6_i1.p1  ORF type:complete len:341 (+),score=77.17 TRINITY_DN3617_c0_g6_i1:63-1025(+)